MLDCEDPVDTSFDQFIATFRKRTIVRKTRKQRFQQPGNLPQARAVEKQPVGCLGTSNSDEDLSRVSGVFRWLEGRMLECEALTL